MRKTTRGALGAVLALFALALVSVPAQAETTVLVSNEGNSFCAEPTEMSPGTEAKKNFKPLTKKHKGPFPESPENCAPGSPTHPAAMAGPGQPASPYTQITGPAAEWVSTKATGASGNIPAYYIYNTTFNLECPNQVEHAEITIKVLADNTTGAFMNGVPIGHLASNLPATNHENFNTPGGKIISGTAGFKVGLNVLQFVVYDESGPFTALNFTAEIKYPPCEIRWFSNKKVLEPGVKEHVMTSGTLTATSNVAEMLVKTKCKVADEEVIENPVGGGNGVDEMTSYNVTGCKAKPSPCPGEPVEIKALGLPWQTHLIAGPPIRDVIEGMELEVLCGGKPIALYSGTLSPLVGKSALEFDAGSGSLSGPAGTTSLSGKDKLKGPPGDEKITAG